MKEFLSWLEKAPKILKIIFALPFLDIVWAVYRIIKGIVYNNMITLIVGILWIIPGAFFCWILDLVFAILDKPLLFTEK